MPLPTKITLEIVTPDRALVSAEVDEVQLPGSEGYFGVLPGHTPMLAALQVGEMWYRIGQDKHFLMIAFGFVEVMPERVTVLAQIAERAEDIDVQRAEHAMQRAKERIGVPGVQTRSDVDFERARIAMMKSIMRIQVASKPRIRS